MLHTRIKYALGLMALLFIAPQLGRAENSATPAESLVIGFHQMYNLDFSAAHKTFEEWEGVHPDDPIGAASNAAAYLFAEFERLHILEFDLFTDNRRVENAGTQLPDPANKSAFESELAKADSIAAKRLAESPDNRNALFARSLADGLRGNYAAL